MGHILSAANLLALDKGEGRIRPIAIGVVLRRLVTKVLMPLANKEAAAFLAPSQVACGVKGGLNASVHELSDVIERFGHLDS